MCQDAKKAYFDAGLNWYPLCPSVHKVIEHSRDSLKEIKAKSCKVSIGDLSETPLEVISYANLKAISHKILNIEMLFIFFTFMKSSCNTIIQ